jgi:hypothetical protein
MKKLLLSALFVATSVAGAFAQAGGTATCAIHMTVQSFMTVTPQNSPNWIPLLTYAGIDLGNLGAGDSGTATYLVQSNSTGGYHGASTVVVTDGAGHAPGANTVVVSSAITASPNSFTADGGGAPTAGDTLTISARTNTQWTTANAVYDYTAVVTLSNYN